MRLTELCGFKASLVYIGSSWPSRTTQQAKERGGGPHPFDIRPLTGRAKRAMKAVLRTGKRQSHLENVNFDFFRRKLRAREKNQGEVLSIRLKILRSNTSPKERVLKKIKYMT